MSRSACPRPGLRLIAATALGLTALTAMAAPASAEVPAATPVTIPGAWIVTLDEGESPDRVSNEHARQHGAQVSHVYQHALMGYAARMSDQAAGRVAQDRRVASVERDRVITAAQTTPTGINRIDGELSSAVSGDMLGLAVNVDVAVIDTGIGPHDDLNVTTGHNCVGTDVGAYQDGNGHGTHVAGTIGAKDDNLGVVGVAPGARLHAVRVLDDAGSGSWSSIICGVDWVTGQKDPQDGTKQLIEVANMSLGGSGRDGACTADALHNAICKSVNAGVTYVVAAGNSKVDAKNFVPAAYDQVITVSALADFDGLIGGKGAFTCRSDKDDTFADFSNYGADVDLIAPGVCINSTWLGGGYSSISGTSMASPHVAGAAALYKSSNAAALPTAVKSALQSTGKTDWDNRDDRDRTKEKLLNVAGL